MNARPSLPEQDESYWRLASAPVIWALHFLLSYATAAVWCAKVAGPDGALGAAWTGGTDKARPSPLDAAIIYAPVGALVPQALKAVR